MEKNGKFYKSAILYYFCTKLPRNYMVVNVKGKRTYKKL
jgi:hypothetical protein